MSLDHRLSTSLSTFAFTNGISYQTLHIARNVFLLWASSNLFFLIRTGREFGRTFVMQSMHKPRRHVPILNSALLGL
jgi:hypothetical protein